TRPRTRAQTQTQTRAPEPEESRARTPQLLRRTHARPCAVYPTPAPRGRARIVHLHKFLIRPGGARVLSSSAGQPLLPTRNCPRPFRSHLRPDVLPPLSQRLRQPSSALPSSATTTTTPSILLPRRTSRPYAHYFSASTAALSGDHGAVGLSLLAGGVHRCLKPGGTGRAPASASTSTSAVPGGAEREQQPSASPPTPVSPSHNQPTHTAFNDSQQLQYAPVVPPALCASVPAFSSEQSQYSTSVVPPPFDLAYLTAQCTSPADIAQLVRLVAQAGYMHALEAAGYNLTESAPCLLRARSSRSTSRRSWTGRSRCCSFMARAGVLSDAGAMAYVGHRIREDFREYVGAKPRESPFEFEDTSSEGSSESLDEDDAASLSGSESSSSSGWPFDRNTRAQPGPPYDNQPHPALRNLRARRPPRAPPGTHAHPSAAPPALAATPLRLSHLGDILTPNPLPRSIDERSALLINVRGSASVLGFGDTGRWLLSALRETCTSSAATGTPLHPSRPARPCRSLFQHSPPPRVRQ
ncbi:hypothetical protein DFH07DRAFT_1021507, partial [Mycena maculata]